MRHSPEEFVRRVHALAVPHLERVVADLGGKADLRQLLPGKMLRSRLAGHVLAAAAEPPAAAEGLSGNGADAAEVAAACAAVELAHTASLCHDDVIDNGLVRRALPTLWRATSPSGAILVGDLVLCAGVELLVRHAGRLLPAFIAKVREVCTAEAEQEILLRGRQLDEATCRRLARAETGPLFAFTAMSCTAEPALAAALEETGYRIGTAYQLGDDLLDVAGSEGQAGKTLGTDRLRLKYTLARAWADDLDALRREVARTCRQAADPLAEWPALRTGVTQFVAAAIEPLFAPAPPQASTPAESSALTAGLVREGVQ